MMILSMYSDWPLSFTRELVKTASTGGPFVAMHPYYIGECTEKPTGQSVIGISHMLEEVATFSPETWSNYSSRVNHTWSSIRVKMCQLVLGWPPTILNENMTQDLTLEPSWKAASGRTWYLIKYHPVLCTPSRVHWRLKEHSAHRGHTIIITMDTCTIGLAHSISAAILMMMCLESCIANHVSRMQSHQ